MCVGGGGGGGAVSAFMCESKRLKRGEYMEGERERWGEREREREREFGSKHTHSRQNKYNINDSRGCQARAERRVSAGTVFSTSV